MKVNLKPIDYTALQFDGTMESINTIRQYAHTIFPTLKEGEKCAEIEVNTNNGDYLQVYEGDILVLSENGLVETFKKVEDFQTKYVEVVIEENKEDKKTKK